MSLAILLLINLFFICSAQVQSGKILGIIVDADTQEPLIHAKVAIKEGNRKLLSNTEGQFTVSNLQQGTYTLTVSYLGYQSKTKRVEVRRNQNGIPK